jgi:adenylate cyclase
LSNDIQVERKLAAVFAADIAGYSRLMDADEVGTLRALAARRAIMDGLIARHRGRIANTAGDSVLAEFPSAVDAVQCAIDAQRALRDAAAGDPPDRPMLFRIGIHVGDVMVRGGDLLGGGVNIAARLEAVAEAGGIVVSATAHEQVRRILPFTYTDLGAQVLKNIEEPIHAFAVAEAGHIPSPSGAATRLAIPGASKPVAVPDKPSIAVLAFENMSGDPEQEYFSDGISEDIITDLSKISGLIVIARNSSFTYKGKAVDLRAVGRDLGVRCVLEGSVRRAGNRIRITAQLIDASNGGHLWAERFDRDLSDLFAVQDDVTSKIVNALKVTLSPAEKTRLGTGGTGNVEAYDYLLRGREFLLGEAKNRETFGQAIKFLTMAIERDPNYSQAYAGRGWAYLFDYQNRWSSDSENGLGLAKRDVARAIELDPTEPLAHVAASMVAAYDADLDRSKSEADIALTLNPNCTEAYACLGQVCTFSGRPLEAIPMLERAMLLDPAYIQQYLHLLGLANVLAGRYEAAAVLLRQRILLVPGTDYSRAILASALGHLGEIDEARRVWRELKDINPQYSFSEHFRRQPFKNKDDVRRIAEGLAKAGLSG